MVLNCSIKKDFEYHKVMPTFRHWKTGAKKFGLTFQTAADAKAFDKGVKAAVSDLSDGQWPFINVFDNRWELISLKIIFLNKGLISWVILSRLGWVSSV